MLSTLISHADCALHQNPAGHPECAERLDAIQNLLVSTGLDALLLQRDAPLATDEDILRVHSSAHLQQLIDKLPHEGIVALADDVALSPGSLTAARRAAGAGLLAVDMILDKKTDGAFCNIRPPGHHAERDRAMGFCLVNNVAVAAAYALEVKQLRRVAIIDIDVHHGNGTQDIFINDNRVLFCSSFQHPFYPNTNIENMPPHILNSPLAATSRGKEFREALDAWIPTLTAFKPQLIFISAGFDGYIDDDMSSVSLVEQDYAWVTKQLRQLMDDSRLLPADEQCLGIVSCLEGGYDTHGLARCVAAHIKALAKLDG